MKSQFRVTIECEKREEEKKEKGRRCYRRKTWLGSLWTDDIQPCSFRFYFLRFELTELPRFWAAITLGIGDLCRSIGQLYSVLGHSLPFNGMN